MKHNTYFAGEIFLIMINNLRVMMLMKSLSFRPFHNPFFGAVNSKAAGQIMKHKSINGNTASGNMF